MGNQYSGRRASPRRLIVNTDLLYEEFFAISSYRRNSRYKELFNGVLPANIIRMARGKRSPVTGEKVFLEIVFDQGGRLCTSVEAYRRYLERLNGKLANIQPQEPIPA